MRQSRPIALLIACIACGSNDSFHPPIPHVVVLVQENHSFDSYFGRWCTAPTGSAPTCHAGPACCEAAPAMDPAGDAPVSLDDMENGAYDPNHSQVCEKTEIDGGRMDQFTQGPPVDSGGLWGPCEDRRNFALAPSGSGSVVDPYRQWAAQYALADHYFQPAAGASSENDMYLAAARFFFVDNTEIPDAMGHQCTVGSGPPKRYQGTTIADIVLQAGGTFAFYAQGYAALQQAEAAGQECPDPPSDCPLGLPVSPCLYSPGDDPFLFFPEFSAPTDNPAYIRGYARLARDVASGQLPSVSFVKAVGYRTEHPGYGTTISAGVDFAKGLVNTIESSSYAKNTLILITWDEGGGFYDHVRPPAGVVDGQDYGTRVPLIAIGPYAKKGYISHVPMEHSSIVKFLEWDFTGNTGQLGARDQVVNNLGSLLDATAVGIAVPER